jgi:DNA-binding Lrp family transcriptional regulator
VGHDAFLIARNLEEDSKLPDLLRLIGGGRSRRPATPGPGLSYLHFDNSRRASSSPRTSRNDLSSPHGGARMRAASTTWEYAMVEAIVLVQAKVGRSSAVAQAVGKIGGVTEAYVVTGPYDLIVRVEAASLDELGQMVASRLQAVEGVSRTLTCPILSL